MIGPIAEGTWGLNCAGLELGGELQLGNAAAHAQWEEAKAKRRAEEAVAEQRRLAECEARIAGADDGEFEDVY
jgi:hypothetical protein